MLLKGILLSLFCSLVSLLIHLVISRLRVGREKGEPQILELIRQAKLLMVIWAAAFLIYLVIFLRPWSGISTFISWLNPSAPIYSFLYGIIVYIILFLIYVTIYYDLDRSVSGTILEMIEKSPAKRLSADQIKRIYNSSNKYQSELKGMLEGGFAIQESGYYKTTLKGSLYGRLARLVKGYFKLGSGG